MSSAELAVQWELSSGEKASPRLVRKILQEHNYLWRPACKKPRLNKKQRKTRVEFCKRHKTWTDRRWRDVIFSDEMNVEVDKRKGRVMLRRTNNEKYNEDCIIQRTKQGSGSICIWACMSYDGVLFFKLFSGRLNSVDYKDILENYMIPAIDLLGDKEHRIFQQDNAPCHTAKIIQEFFKENDIKVLAWSRS
jgi:Transposase/DDE superfamily endonuclease